MKKFMFLHCGFEKPDEEMMNKWKAWFASIAPHQVDQAGFGAAREISADGTKDIPWNSDSITGFNVVEAEDLDAATKLAEGCPFISSIRIYELRTH